MTGTHIRMYKATRIYVQPYTYIRVMRPLTERQYLLRMSLPYLVISNK